MRHQAAIEARALAGYSAQTKLSTNTAVYQAVLSCSPRWLGLLTGIAALKLVSSYKIAVLLDPKALGYDARRGACKRDF